MDNKVQLILSALDQTKPAFAAVQGHLTTLKQRAHDVIGSMTGMKAAIVSLVGGMVMRKLLSEIIAFNSTLETSKLGIAGILTSMTEITDAQGNTLQGADKFAASQKIAVGLQKELLAIGMNTAATYRELVEVYQGILAPALGAKMSMKETLEITGLLTNAVKSIGLPMNQIKQESRDLIQGGIQAASSSLATALGINDKMVKQWRETGTLFKELKTRLEGFVFASNEFQGTWEGIWSNFKDVMQMLMGMGGADIFAGLKKSFAEITSMLVTVRKDASGAVEGVDIKPQVLYRARQLGAILAEMLDVLKQMAYWAWEFAKRIPVVGSVLSGINLKRSWDTISKKLAEQGTALSTQMDSEDLDKLLQKGMSPEEIADAISAGVVKIGGERKAKTWVPGVTRLLGGAGYWEEGQLEEFRKKRAEAEMAKGYDVKIKKSPPSDEMVKKNDKLQEQIDKLKFSEEKLIELEAKRYRAEGLAKKLVAEWEELSLQKLRFEAAEKAYKAEQEQQAAATEAIVQRIEYEKKLLDLEAEISKRRDTMAVEQGRMTSAQAIQNEYDLKRRIMGREAEAINAKMLGLGTTADTDPKAMEYSREYLALQERIRLSFQEQGLAIEERTEAEKKEAYSTIKDYAKGYRMYEETQLEDLARKMRRAGIEEVDINRWKVEQIRQLDLQRWQFQLDNADDYMEAMEAQYNLMVLTAKSAATKAAEAFRETFDDIKGTISDLIMDSINGFKNWEQIVTRMLERVLKRFIDMELDNLFYGTAGKGGGGGLLGLLGGLLGFGGGGAAAASGIGPISGAMSGPSGIIGEIGMWHGGGMGYETPSRYRLVATAAERFHTGIGPGERPAIIRTDEGVFTPGQMRALGLMATGQTAPQGNLTISVGGVSINGAKIGNKDIADLRGAIEGVCDDWARRRF